MFDMNNIVINYINTPIAFVASQEIQQTHTMLYTSYHHHKENYFYTRKK